MLRLLEVCVNKVNEVTRGQQHIGVTVRDFLETPEVRPMILETSDNIPGTIHVSMICNHQEPVPADFGSGNNEYGKSRNVNLSLCFFLRLTT